VLLPSSILAVIELSFSPITQVGQWTVRLETIAIAVAVFVSLIAAVLIARRTPVDLTRSADDVDATTFEPNHLRADDLLFITVAALPGAVVGGRIGYVLLHAEYYAANPGAILDFGQGGFELSLAVVGGTITAVVVAALLGTPVGRWMHAAILPLLVALAGGKLAMVLGGDGQGAPWDGAWATAYLGPGPWMSLAPALPSHPSQAYEGLATAGVALVILGLIAVGAFRRRAGGAFLVGIALWSLARAAVATTWRDPAVVGTARTDQVICLAIAAGALLLLVARAASTRGRRTAPEVAPAEDPRSVAVEAAGMPPPAGASGGPTAGTPEWPDPTSRPRV
jgi:phosphatidylglycerol:prolipoprotein diacylglycerol transferase